MRRMPRLSTSICLCFALTAAFAASSAHAQNWPRFRGPRGAGVSDLKGVPREWQESDYEWTVDLPGVGHSSPVVWGQTLFVTSADEEGRRTLFCIDADTGKQKWHHSVSLNKNHLHHMNSYASGTPAVDEERVYVGFADADHYLVSAFDFKGEQVWTRDLGPCSTEHGHGVSPILHEDLVIICNDQAPAENGAAPPSAVIALNRHTGDVVWHAERRSRDASYATPIVIHPEGAAPQLIVLSGANGLAGLDLMTGREIWSSGELPRRTVGSPVYAGGLLFATCGQGGRGEHMVCVDPTGRGDVSQTHIRYVRDRELPYVPTPVSNDRELFLWNDDGTFFTVDVRTGKNLSRQRIGGNYFASPIMIDGRIFCVSQEGEVVVLEPGDELRIFRSPLGDPSYASPAVANGRVYFRGFKKLASLKARS
ncbi:MAG: PQQ-binding-like beta-propeller repeat protein [Planctomyces sp.]|nr:PQQ-binding-like beta-propeller repeat protein [Planctomyces sp.]